MWLNDFVCIWADVYKQAAGLTRGVFSPDNQHGTRQSLRWKVNFENLDVWVQYYLAFVYGVYLYHLQTLKGYK